MEESLITPEAKAMIGKEVGRQSGTLYRKEAQRFAAAVGDLNPLYFDDSVASSREEARGFEIDNRVFSSVCRTRRFFGGTDTLSRL